MRFANHSVVVTGAGSGIGAAMTAQFLAEGATVVAADRDLAGVPQGAIGVAADVRLEADVCRIVGTALRETGRLDVVCNNAGIGSTATASSCSLEEWEDVFAVNVRGVFLGTKYALEAMLAHQGGVIINTASIAGLVGLPNRAAYCASKGAVVAFTRQVAVEYAQHGIRCNCICPGTVDSPWVERLVTTSEDGAATRAALIARQPIGRLARPEEIARAALYLASEDAAFMTGTALVIDGGITAQ